MFARVKESMGFKEAMQDAGYNPIVSGGHISQFGNYGHNATNLRPNGSIVTQTQTAGGADQRFSLFGSKKEN